MCSWPSIQHVVHLAYHHSLVSRSKKFSFQWIENLSQIDLNSFRLAKIPVPKIPVIPDSTSNWVEGIRCWLGYVLLLKTVLRLRGIIGLIYPVVLEQFCFPLLYVVAFTWRLHTDSWWYTIPWLSTTVHSSNALRSSVSTHWDDNRQICLCSSVCLHGAPPKLLSAWLWNHSPPRSFCFLKPPPTSVL